jgi:Tol biopolymer transport system component
VGYDGIEIWMSAADGSSGSKIFSSTGRGNVPWAAISPDGKKIVFDPGGGPTMYIADVDKHTVQQLLNNPGEWIGEPAWSPDGRSIAYQRAGDIWVMNSDGTNQKKLTTGGGSPDWSPDGTKILFWGYRSNPAGIWVV